MRKLSETIDEVIALADAIRNYWDVELPKRHPEYPIVHPGEDSGPPPPEEKALSDLLAGLPEEDVYKIALVMFLGRGDFGADDLVEGYEALKRRFGAPEHAASQMLEKAPLADYLADGLAELKKNGIDADQLTFASVGSGG